MYYDADLMKERYEKALERIANFGHAESCTSSAPVYECGCYEKSQSEIAREALGWSDS